MASLKCMKDKFYKELDNLIRSKADNSTFIPKEKYVELINLVIEAKGKQTGKTPVEYARLRRFDLIKEGNDIQLIYPHTDDNSPIKHYVYVEEIFDVIHSTHLSIEHAGRNRMMKELQQHYKNITAETVMLYINLCEVCKLKSNNLKRNSISTNENELSKLILLDVETLQNLSKKSSQLNDCIDDLVKKSRYSFLINSQEENQQISICVPSSTSSTSATYYCCVLGCNRNSENSPKSKFHALPILDGIHSNDEKSQFLSKQLKICDEHFKQNCEISNSNNEPNTTFTMNVVMPSVNTKRTQNTQEYQEANFILGSNEIPMTGGTTEIVEEEIITEDTQEEEEEVKYSVMLQSDNYVEIKTEEYYDLNNMCRVCLTTENLKQIETEYVENILIYDMLQSCVNMNTLEEQKLPKQICLLCLEELKVTYNFLQKFQNSKNNLENYISKQQDINERRFYLEHGYINQSVNITDSVDASEGVPSTSKGHKSDLEEIRISNTINSLSKELVQNINEKSTLELDGKTYVLAKVFLCKSCNELIFVQESLDEHKCDTKKKAHVVKYSNNNLVIRQTDINRCKKCGRKFTNLARHKCPVLSSTSEATSDKDLLQKCPKCKLKFKFYHKCEADTHSSKKMPIVIK